MLTPGTASTAVLTRAALWRLTLQLLALLPNFLFGISIGDAILHSKVSISVINLVDADPANLAPLAAAGS